MGLFGKLFNKKAESKKGFYTATVENIVKETSDTVSISFKIAEIDKHNFVFQAGQYLNLALNIDGEEVRRSYSICSGAGEALTIAVKQVENGKASVFLNNVLKTGDELFISKPEGNFVLPQETKTIVAFAAGSGITPILSFAKKLDAQNGKMHLFYGSKTEDDIIFKKTLDNLATTVDTKHYLSRETKDGFETGRLTKEAILSALKENLSLLKADGFYLCGPEEMIMNASEVLKTLGVHEEKINYELFTTPTLMKPKETEVVSDFKGLSKVTVILDQEETTFELSADGDTILNELESEGIDAPYSCKGGVCSTCKAKVLKGAVTMDLNYTLTDAEVAEGYVLCCQAHPNSNEVILSYDD
ncbi:MAG: 2Fe-2S iron-sulfur cluster-binding protein [Lishizhenia sp.]